MKPGKKESNPVNCAEEKGDRMKLFHLSVLLLLAIFPLASRAQDNNSDSPGGSTPAPIPDAQPTSSKPASSAEIRKPKKVWTNDEIKSLKGSISVVGDSSGSSGDLDLKKLPRASGEKDLRQQRIDKYRNQIQDLQAQIDAADLRITQLRNFKGENPAPSGGINPAHSYNMVPLEEQVKQLEEKKKQLTAKIDDLENEAKKIGIAPGDLR
jgi:outer membrane murein-binding lipoprotein Lpp